MSTLLSEQRLNLNETAELAGVVPSTVWRWAITGVRGVQLETIVIGARRFTSREAFDRFIAATTHAAAQRTGEQPDAAAERDPPSRSAS